jgi:hypothetical protein
MFNPTAGFSEADSKNFLSSYLSGSGPSENFEYNSPFSAELAQGHQKNKKIGSIPARDISNMPYSHGEYGLFGQPGITMSGGYKGYDQSSREAEHSRINQYINNPRHGNPRGLFQSVPLGIEQRAADFIRMFGKIGK